MKRYRKERPWFCEDEQIPQELRQARRTLQEGRRLIAGADTPRYQLPGFWRDSR